MSHELARATAKLQRVMDGEPPEPIAPVPQRASVGFTDHTGRDQQLILRDTPSSPATSAELAEVCAALESRPNINFLNLGEINIDTDLSIVMTMLETTKTLNKLKTPHVKFLRMDDVPGAMRRNPVLELEYWRVDVESGCYTFGFRNR